MALIALSVVGCIDYLAYGAFFTRVMFLPKKKLAVFFFARIAVDACWEVVHSLVNCFLDRLLILHSQCPNNFIISGGAFLANERRIVICLDRLSLSFKENLQASIASGTNDRGHRTK